MATATALRCRHQFRSRFGELPRSNRQVTDVSNLEYDDRYPEAMLQLGMLLLGEEPLDDLLDRVVELAVETIAPARFASITVSDRSGRHTSNSTGAEALAADQAQYDDGGGPCLEATESGRQIELDMDDAGQWPSFAATARGLGVGRVLSTPLVKHGETIGALNVYTEGSEPLTDGQLRAASMFAGQASVVLANALTLMGATDLAKQLEQALASREIIGEAKGILMERESCDRTVAFDILRRASQRQNRKLRDLAEELVDTVESRAKKR